MNKELDYSALINEKKLNYGLIGFGAVVLVLVIAMQSSPRGKAEVVVKLLLTLAITASVVYLVFLWWARQRAIKQFALKNKLVAMDQITMDASIPPCFKDIGDSPKALNGYTFSFGKGTCNVFEYHYSTGSGKSRQIHYYSVATFINEKSFPHLYLDGKKNGSFCNYNRNQRVSLEGDFDQYFSLYVPDGEQIDALSILSPDVMQTLIDGGRPFDIEINGKSVYLIARLTLYDAKKLPAALSFLASLEAEFDQRNVSWQPLSPDIAAPGLKRGLTDAQIITIAVVAIIFVAYAITTVFFGAPSTTPIPK